MTKYLALGYSFEQMREWCWLNNIEVRNVKYIFDKEDSKEVEYDLILFDGYSDWYSPEMIDSIVKKAERFHWFSDGPIVKAGEIIGWRDIGRNSELAELREELAGYIHRFITQFEWENPGMTAESERQRYRELTGKEYDDE